MRWFKNLRVRPKLLISFVIVITFAIILAALALYTTTSLDNDYTYLLDYPELRLRYLNGLNSNLIDMRRCTATLVLNMTNPDTIENYWSQFEKAYNSAIENCNSYIASNTADTVRDQSALQKNTQIMEGILIEINSYKTIADDMISVARSTHDQALTNSIIIKGASIVTGVQATTQELVESATSYIGEISTRNTQIKNTFILVISVISGVIAAISILIALYISSLISKPLGKVSQIMDQVSKTGSLEFSEETKKSLLKETNGKDEIATTIASTIKAVQHFEGVSGVLRLVADGDLTMEVSLQSPDDTMGNALKKMVEGLNLMFGEIGSSTVQVSAASKQIADGSQALAQGSTQQASAVQELSASINEIAEKTKQNAKIAGEAAVVSDAIKSGAEKSSGQMTQMMQAVKEINNASSQIEKVIKVIDDIAFQTNILALNAAVEAARAGQHGKGFAVVAEEVRNLAAKSAEAAKETGGLIENSVEKANFGMSIATATEDSLHEIVTGINKSAEIIAEIARSSDEQANAIAQINTGIEQVAQVVQQNSATAEESAAASQQMSAQSGMLERLISRFRLR